MAAINLLLIFLRIKLFIENLSFLFYTIITKKNLHKRPKFTAILNVLDIGIDVSDKCFVFLERVNYDIFWFHIWLRFAYFWWSETHSPMCILTFPLHMSSSVHHGILLNEKLYYEGTYDGELLPFGSLKIALKID